MARNRSSAAKAKPRRTKKTTPQKRKRAIEIPALAMSVDQFCTLHNIGRDLFYVLLREGKGPECMMLGKRRLISLEAAAAWRAARGSASAATTEAAA